MKILNNKTIIQQKFLISSVSKLSTASSHRFNNEITKHLKPSEIIASHQLLMPVSNFFNLSLLTIHSRRFSTSRLDLNFNLDRNKPKSKDRGTTWNPRGLTGHSGKKHKQAQFDQRDSYTKLLRRS